MKVFEKVPEAKLDYVFDWSVWLKTDEIDLISIAPSGGNVDIEDATELDGKVTVWVSGGTVNLSGIVTCEIDTVEGRHDSRSARFDIVEYK